MSISRNAIAVIFYTFSCLLLLISSILSWLDSWIYFNLIILLISSLMVAFFSLIVSGNIFSILFIFISFWILYGLSGPVAVVFGIDFPDIFPEPYLVSYFLLHFSLGSVGLISGILAGFLCLRPSLRSSNEKASQSFLVLCALVFSFLALFFELVNFTRAGGIEAVLSGKAAYQSAISELTATLPTQVVATAAFAFLGLIFSKRRDGKIWLFICAMVLFPAISVSIVLGQRGAILTYGMAFFIGVFYERPLSKLRLKLISAALIAYVFMGFIYGLRASAWREISNNFGAGLTLIVEKIQSVKFWASSLNPGSNEFGAPFGNFNTYVVSGGKAAVKWGETYLNGLTIIVPRFIWPDKPISATYEFRDAFFPFEAERGQIAGTAYSSILEAYTNFGSIGVLIVFGIFGLFLITLEKLKARFQGIVYFTFYVMFVTFSIWSHRSALEFPLFWPLVMAACAYTLLLWWRSIGVGRPQMRQLRNA
jgi:hypothetical protein